MTWSRLRLLRSEKVDRSTATTPSTTPVARDPAKAAIALYTASLFIGTPGRRPSRGYPPSSRFQSSDFFSGAGSTECKSVAISDQSCAAGNARLPRIASIQCLGEFVGRAVRRHHRAIGQRVCCTAIDGPRKLLVRLARDSFVEGQVESARPPGFGQKVSVLVLPVPAKAAILSGRRVRNFPTARSCSPVGLTMRNLCSRCEYPTSSPRLRMLVASCHERDDTQSHESVKARKVIEYNECHCGEALRITAVYSSHRLPVPI